MLEKQVKTERAKSRQRKSKMQDDKERMKTNILRFLYIESMIMFFIMCMATSLATPLFNFLYSSKWNAVIPLFQILCIWGLLRPISTILANVLMASGDSGICMHGSVLFQVPSLIRLLYNTEQSPLCYSGSLLVIHFKYSSA